MFMQQQQQYGHGVPNGWLLASLYLLLTLHAVQASHRPQRRQDSHRRDDSGSGRRLYLNLRAHVQQSLKSTCGQLHALGGCLLLSHVTSALPHTVMWVQFCKPHDQCRIFITIMKLCSHGGVGFGTSVVSQARGHERLRVQSKRPSTGVLAFICTTHFEAHTYIAVCVCWREVHQLDRPCKAGTERLQ